MAPLAAFGRARGYGATGGIVPPCRRYRSSARRTPTAIALVLLAAILAACSSSPVADRSTTTSTTADPTAGINAQILTAWRAAENAFYQAEADPTGTISPALDATMTGQELELVKSNLATQESEGFLGQGSWDLGSPRVVSIGPTESDPTTATVTSCVHDTQVLVNEHTGQPAPGPNGTPEWAGQTSTMTLSGGTWKLSEQSGVGNTNRQIACAGVG